MSLFKKIFFFLAVLFYAGIHSNAQQETTLPFLTWAPQAGYYDLTIKPDQYKTSVALPILGSLQFYYMNSGFRMSSMLNGSVIQPNNVIPELKKINHLNTGASIDLVNVRFHIKETFFQVSVRDVLTERFDYTHDLMNLIWNGNASYAGQTINLDNVRLAVNYYREYAVSATRELNKKLTVGVRAKFLTGIANISTRESESSLYTDPNGLSLTGNSQVTMLSAGMINSKNISGKDLMGLNNPGAAMDLGARYKVSEKISIACNVTNLGFIHYAGNVQNNVVNGNYTYSGYVMRDSASIVNASWQNILDTLKSIFKPSQNSKAYNSWLSPTIYISGNYKITKNTMLYGSLASSVYYGYHSTFTAGAVHNIGKTLQITMNYSIMANNYFNIGGGFVVRGGPAQLFLTCDNLPAFFEPMNVKYFNVRTGINLVFGKTDSAKETSKNIFKKS